MAPAARDPVWEFPRLRASFNFEVRSISSVWPGDLLRVLTKLSLQDDFKFTKKDEDNDTGISFFSAPMTTIYNTFH